MFIIDCKMIKIPRCDPGCKKKTFISVESINLMILMMSLIDDIIFKIKIKISQSVPSESSTSM